MNLKRGLLLVLTVLLLAFSIINFIIFSTTTTTPITGKATNAAQGTASLCIGHPPTITAIADQTATNGTPYSLQVNVKFHGSNTSWRYFDNSTLFDINQSGYLNFTPVINDNGTYTILITVEDGTICVAMNSSTTFQLTIPGVGGGGGGEVVPTPTPAAPNTGGGGGGGTALAKAALPPSFDMSEEEVKVTVKQSQSVEKPIIITNDGKITLDFTITNVLGVVSVSPNKFKLQPGEKKAITLIFNPAKNAIPDVYTGIITVRGGSLKKNVIIIVEVESDRVLFDGSIDLRKKVLHPGENLEGTYYITGLLPSAMINVVYTIYDLENRHYYVEEENLTIDQQISFTKSITLPRGLPPGGYVIAMKIIYKNSFATATELFTVEAPLSALAGLAAPIAERPLFTLAIPLMIILLLVILTFLFFMHRHIKRQKILAGPKTIIQQKTIQKTIQKTVVQPQIKTIVDWDSSLIQRKLSVLREGYEKKLIQPETYHKAKEALEALLAQKK